MKNYSQYVNHIKESLYGEVPSDEELKVMYPGYDTYAQRAMRWKQDREIALRDKEAMRLGQEDLALSMVSERNNILSKLGGMIAKAQREDKSFMEELLSLMEKYSHLIEDTSFKAQPMTRGGKPAKVVGTGSDPIPGTEQKKHF